VVQEANTYERRLNEDDLGGRANKLGEEPKKGTFTAGSSGRHNNADEEEQTGSQHNPEKY